MCEPDDWLLSPQPVAMLTMLCLLLSAFFVRASWNGCVSHFVSLQTRALTPTSIGCTTTSRTHSSAASSDAHWRFRRLTRPSRRARRCRLPPPRPTRPSMTPPRRATIRRRPCQRHGQRGDRRIDARPVSRRRSHRASRTCARTIGGNSRPRRLSPTRGNSQHCNCRPSRVSRVRRRARATRRSTRHKQP